MDILYRGTPNSFDIRHRGEFSGFPSPPSMLDELSRRATASSSIRQSEHDIDDDVSGEFLFPGVSYDMEASEPAAGTSMLSPTLPEFAFNSTESFGTALANKLAKTEAETGRSKLDISSSDNSGDSSYDVPAAALRAPLPCSSRPSSERPPAPTPRHMARISMPDVPVPAHRTARSKESDPPPPYSREYEPATTADDSLFTAQTPTPHLSHAPFDLRSPFASRKKKSKYFGVRQ
ncbi:hypothetical protein FA95DRAFT_775447 [Auriscalpium vulgare]|uniref:Uncharacterized protein n=1 Tax=Auriscalpium vulgare TaxID=40419 RepID=A0ACB8S158_9AGAM|nr:hypothetical protein FA95DRAFT_775447 [Auriscalpium vulgare]